jgi:hypothetical protein
MSCVQQSGSVCSGEWEGKGGVAEDGWGSGEL